VLPPARPLIPVASSGPLGLGCKGDLRFSAGRCRLGCSLGPRLSRVGFPGGVGEVAAAAQPWNKSLRPCLRFAGVRFRAGERPVREGSLDSGWRFAAAGSFSVLVDLFLGSCSPAVRASVEFCRGEAVGSWASRWMVRCFFLAACRREALIHGYRSPGCVPDRGSFMEFIYCGSSQSQCAMGFLLASVVLLSASSSGHGFSVDGGGRRWWWSGGAEGPVDLVVIYFLLGSFVQKVGTAVPLCNLPVGSCTCMVRMCVFFIV